MSSELSLTVERDAGRHVVPVVEQHRRLYGLWHGRSQEMQMKGSGSAKSSYIVDYH